MVASMVAPICAAMGFAAVMNATGCDRHLVHLLLAPIRRVPWLVTPGGILAAYFVNMAVPSQTSTAAALGPILVPLLLASGHTRTVAGAALILGASFGGDLLNPGAQDVQAVAGAANLAAADLSVRVIPASLAALQWLVAVPASDDWRPLANALPVVRAMLIGAALAVAVGWRELRGLSKSFFDGMGNAYANIISLTITAQCFGAGIALAGVGDALLRLASASGALALLAGGFPWALSTLSGSGSGPILAFAQTFLTHVDPSRDPVKLAALACLGGAFGRTSSPVAAVVVYTSGLVAVPPVPLVRRLLPALVAGAAVAFTLAAR